MAQTVDQDGAVIQTKRSKTLLVRHLPSELTRNDKEDLLKYFGAISVRVFSDKGRLKHTAFASFASENAAAKALARLHQLKLLNHTLVVEFAKDQESANLLNQPHISDGCLDADKDIKEEKVKQPQNIPLIETGVAPNHGLKYQINPCLKYLYPPPTSGILANIANALASVPKFYVQVLHLMNKMNLPSPFGPITARPPLYEDLVPAPPPPMPPLPPEGPPLPEEEMEFSSEEESEYESEDDEEKERMVRLMGLANLPCKRPQRKKVSSRKKPKLKDLLPVVKSDSHSASVALQPSDVFEQPQSCGQKKIEFHISADVSDIFQGGLHPAAETDKTEDNAATEAPADEVEAVGFGKIYPTPRITDPEEESEEDEEIPSEFISRRELEKGRISRDEMKRLSVFKNYEPGDPTCRLYVKNVAKQVEEKDLKFIFGRYVDISSDDERNMFDIILMKEGRMKGQAFIGLPSEKAASKALKDTNGYILFDKPLVVQFARSARPKPDPKDAKKGQKKL
ncbi:RNA-binding region-containing protein 3 isoform X2 [Amia ocellicauda]|uniref:RNA-binding region-containing protein 3 isoform X2 n=1 Tax=Amia ocellicauda TaxID=2972642 RepID=UPI003464DA70